MTVTTERGREARRRLLQAAAELVAERGWGAVTTRLLAQRAGVAPGVVHYHFPSVQSVLVLAASEAARSAGAELGAALDEASSAEEALGVLLREVDRYSGTDPVSVLFVEAYLAAARDEELRRDLGQVVEDLRQQVARRLAAHQVPDPTTTAAVLVAAIDGVLLHRALMPGPEPAALSLVLGRLLQPWSGAAR